MMRTVSLFFVLVLCYAFIGSRAEFNALNKETSTPLKMPKDLSIFTGEMMYVPGGTFASAEYTDPRNFQSARSSMITIHSFSLGSTEVTNLQYHTFYQEMIKVVGLDSAKKLLPDTASFEKDRRMYGFGDMYKEFYFSHAAYKNAPVVGVNWLQAKAYCAWINKKSEDLVKLHPEWKDKYELGWFRLPLDLEWEYAACGKYTYLNGNPICSWGYEAFHVEKNKVVPNGNFKSTSDEDGYTYFEKGNMDLIDNAKSYQPNMYGLYNMSGNVFEWSISTYDPEIFTFSHDLNPPRRGASLLDAELKYQDKLFRPGEDTKVIKGGSFLYGPAYSAAGLVMSLAPDSSRCDVGFRLAMSYLGREKTK
jgi:formylglycine-generating enzyme required for sulfatase activity